MPQDDDNDTRPAGDPYPEAAEAEVSNFAYFDVLHLVRHPQAPPDLGGRAKWQLSHDYRVAFDVAAGGESWRQEFVVPRGLFNDLSSVPPLLWSLVGPIGPHLEASIVHDYLYMAWTDHRDTPRRADRDFADAVFLAAMRAATDQKRWRRWAIHKAVRAFGWSVFKGKDYKLADKLAEWREYLDAAERDDG